MNSLLRQLERAGRWSEDALLVVLLTGMIMLAAAQILGRNLVGQSFVLGDEALRLMVLWLTLAGAMAASRADRHISISLLDRLLSGRALLAVRALTHAFTATVCGFIAWHSLQFVRTSHEFGDVLLGNWPAWPLQAILPLGFGLMAWRHMLHAIRQALATGGRGAA